MSHPSRSSARVDARPGKGKLTSPDGRCYEGDFAQGDMHGHGVMTEADGSKKDTGRRVDLEGGGGFLAWVDLEGVWIPDTKQVNLVTVVSSLSDRWPSDSSSFGPSAILSSLRRSHAVL